jgi:hypothetical protein
MHALRCKLELQAPKSDMTSEQEANHKIVTFIIKRLLLTAKIGHNLKQETTDLLRTT